MEELKLFDTVYVGDNKVPAIIIDIGNLVTVDTIYSGCYKVPMEALEKMPRPKALLTIKSNIPQEDIDKIKKIFQESVSNPTSSFRTPIINKETK